MFLLCYLNYSKPVFAVAKDNIDYIIGSIFANYLGKEDLCLETFNSTLISHEESNLNMQPYDINVEITSDNPLKTFRGIAKEYEAAYIFDDGSVYQYRNGEFVFLKKTDYQLNTCITCGKSFFAKDMAEDICIDCLLNVDINTFLPAGSEQYTEYENCSKVFDAVSIFKSSLENFVLTDTMKIKAKNIVKEYLHKEKIPEKYHTIALEGLAA